MIVEFTTLSALGQVQGTVVRPTTRRLTTRQPSSVRSYNSHFMTQCETHNIRQQTTDLLQHVRVECPPVSPTTTRSIQLFHSQMDEIKLGAEQHCRKILKPAVSFSPPVKFWYDKIHAYQQLIRLKEGGHPGMNRDHTYRLARHKNIQHPYDLSVDQCKEGIRLAKLQQKEVRKQEVLHRKSHLAQCLQTAIDSGNEERQKEIKIRMRREHGKRVWRNINRVTRPQTGRSCLQAQEIIAGEVVTHVDQAGVEGAIQRKVEGRFRLAHSTPIERTLLGHQLRYHTDPNIALQIISGTYEIPDEVDSATAALLVAIGELGKRVMAGEQLADLWITGHDCQRYWERLNENTSSSPSGLHLGHWMSAVSSPELAELLADQMNLIIYSGVAPLRWGIALQVLLEKVAGVCLITKLRSIQLYEADYNWFNKLIFNKNTTARKKAWRRMLVLIRSSLSLSAGTSSNGSCVGGCSPMLRPCQSHHDVSCLDSPRGFSDCYLHYCGLPL